MSDEQIPLMLRTAKVNQSATVAAREAMQLANSLEDVGYFCVFAIVGHSAALASMAARGIEGSLHNALFVLDLDRLDVFHGLEANVIHGQIIHFTTETTGKVQMLRNISKMDFRVYQHVCSHGLRWQILKLPF